MVENLDKGHKAHMFVTKIMSYSFKERFDHLHEDVANIHRYLNETSKVVLHKHMYNQEDGNEGEVTENHSHNSFTDPDHVTDHVTDREDKA